MRAVARDRTVHGALGTRVLWTIVGALLVTWAFKLLAFVSTFAGIALLQLGLGVAGVGVFALAWSVRRLDGAFPRRAFFAAAVLTVLAFAVWSLMQIRANPGYGTDEIAFDQYAAQLAAHLHNPYAHSMAPAFNLFNVSPDGYTFHLNGSPVTSLSYPALSFLVYVPFVWAHVAQLGVWMNVAFWAASVLLAYRLLDGSMKPVALILGSFGVFTGFAVGGVTDIVYLVPLTYAVYQWDRYHAVGTWRARSMAIAMGLALSVKQTPWIVLPFLVIALYLEARARGGARSARRLVVRYLAWSVGTFVLINAPYIAVGPTNWLRGVLTPLRSSIVPAGQGAVALSLYLGLGGGQLRYYTGALVLMSVAALVIFTVSYPRFKALTVLAPAFIMLFADRSFASYLLMPVLPGLVAMLSTRRVERDVIGASVLSAHARTTLWRVAIGAACLGGVFVALALGTPAPVSVAISSVRTTGQLATIVQVDAWVHNVTSHPVSPAFTVDQGGQVSAFWIRASGPRTLGAHEGAHYTLLAPNFFAQPPITGGFQLVAFTSAPASVAVSHPFIANQVHVELLPQAVNAPVPVGEAVALSAHVVNALDQPVRGAGVPVYLGQVVYTQGGLVYGEASINAQSVGKTPVVAYTNASGVATFSVVGTLGSNDPVYFEANLVNGSSFYPYGYSDIVPIRFTRTTP